MVIGIDLGTTFSAAARITSDGHAEIITNRDGDRTTPSVVMFEDGVAVIGEQAKENSVSSPFSVCQFVKRQMGRKSFRFDVSDKESYTAEEISAMILRRIKEDAEDITGETVEGAVITVPAYFDDTQRTSTYNAGEIAGLKVLGIINEPTAAAIAYCNGMNCASGNVMVYDLGGGTFDITVMKISENFEKVDILSTTGNRNLGGFDFDNAIISKVVDEFNSQYGVDIEDDDTAMQELRIKAENAKKSLSSRPKTSLTIASGGNTLKVTITKEEFNVLIEKYISSTKTSMEIALEDAGIGWGDISKILLVGGSTRIPVIQDMIKETAGIEPSRELNPDEAVAIGAAYYANSKGVVDGSSAPNIKKMEITDVVSHSLGILAKNEGRMSAMFLIKRNSPLPVTESRDFSTIDNNQTRFDLKVVEGEDEDPDYDTIIGQATIMLTPRPKGSPVRVHMLCDSDGIIHVKVEDVVDGKDLGEIEIKRDANLSAEEVEQKKNALKNISID